MKTSMASVRQKIALVGPVEPWRGGIAQYTTQLRLALDAQADVRTISFKRMYPQFLYPGKGDKEPGTGPLPGVSYCLDIYSPLSLRKAADDIIKSGCEVAIFDWWTLIWQPGFVRIARRLKKRGIKVVFLCHNLFDHDAQGLKRQLSERMLRVADAYIVHAKDSEQLLTSIRPEAPILRRTHPIYGQFPAPNKRLKKRGRLELLFFGMVRPYKGLDVLVDALAQLNDQEVFLTVAGEAWGDTNEIRHQLLSKAAPNLELHLEYIKDTEAANYFARADVIVLPYRSATGSGVLALAYHYGKPVLATKVGGLQDAIEDGKTGWLVAPESPKALADAIATMSRKDLTNMTQHITTFCDENSWDAFAQVTLDFTAKLVGKSKLQ